MNCSRLFFSDYDLFCLGMNMKREKSAYSSLQLFVHDGQMVAVLLKLGILKKYVSLKTKITSKTGSVPSFPLFLETSPNYKMLLLLIIIILVAEVGVPIIFKGLFLQKKIPLVEKTLKK